MLISQSDIEALPDDPKQRFVGIEALCRKRIDALTHADEDWSASADARLEYISIMIAAARECDIDYIKDLEVPKRSSFDPTNYGEFVSDISFYTAQLMMQAASKNSRLSIALDGTTRDRIRALASHLRDHVEKTDLPPHRKAKLYAQIEDFLSELEKPRLNFAMIGMFMLAITGHIADVGGAEAVFKELYQDITSSLVHAREQQEEHTRLHNLLPAPPKRLTPPRSEAPAQESRRQFGRSGTMADAIDDDIPF